MRVTFFGAAREVSGSNILIEGAGKKILLECGLIQGLGAQHRNFLPLPFDASTIDFVIVGHGHLDHTGRLPLLVKDGFSGKVFATAPTKEITKLVLEDNERLMRQESARHKRKTLYRRKDIDKIIELFESLAYDETLEISPGIKLTFRNAGHILGSAITILEIEGKKLVFTSDLGNQPSELMSPPQPVDEADYVICESTYGSRVHEDVGKKHAKLSQILLSTIKEDGVLLIPAFAIERTQELLHDIEHFCTTNNCLIPTFFLDSPLAEKVTTVFEKYPEFLNPGIVNLHLGKNVFGLGRVKITSKASESRKIEGVPNPKIIIAGSGMLSGGRILYHLQNYIDKAKNALLIVGYQAKGTLGRRLLEGAKKIKIYGKTFNVAAKVIAIGSYSAHADSVQIISWLGHIKNKRQIFFVHGEEEQALSLAENAKLKFAVKTIVPRQGESFVL